MSIHGLSGAEYHRLIVGELLELPRHLEFASGPDCVEFGSNFTDLCNCAVMMSRTLWYPANFIQKGTAGAREVSAAYIRDVRRFILPPDEEHKEERVFCKFELAAEGRSSKDMRDIFIAYHTQRLSLDPRYKDDYRNAITLLVGHYLDARDAKKAKDAERLNANGQESIIVNVA